MPGILGPPSKKALCDVLLTAYEIGSAPRSFRSSLEILEYDYTMQDVAFAATAPTYFSP